ncbi:MAG TPA: TIGR03905 family TSCPD domain-containing protein [Erysipelotrichaceae bacterium]|nr:TIGR03905 family TSCPD domain-containing protein [Erysipelotrichaceae bacterium]
MSTHYEYSPKGTCSTKMIFELDGDTVESMEVIHGCNGNLKGIASLVKGRKIDEVIEALDGITCGMKPTSCPDQIAKGLKAYIAQRG